MRSSPRLSFFAACCTAAMMTLPTVARTYEYTLTSAPAGWTFSVSGNTKFTGNGYCFANADAEMQTAEFDGPITNIVFSGYRTSSCNRQIRFTAGDVRETWPTGTLVDTSLSEFKVVQLDAEDNITSFNLKSAGGSQNFYLKTVVVYIADTAPAVAPIADQQVGSNGTMGVEFGVDLHGVWEQVVLSVAAENLDSPGTPIPANSYEIDDDIYGHQRCFFYFTPATAGITSGRIRFTITATGQGGSTSQSFVCTVVQGVVKSKPIITYVPIAQGVKANRPFTGGITVTEADGDVVQVTVSATCNGPYSYNQSTGIFTFTPTSADVALSPITFTVQATDPEGTAEDTFVLYVEPVSAPLVEPIADQTVAYGSGALFYVTFVEMDGDEITSSGVSVKTGTEAPIGTTDFSTYNFDPNSYYFRFEPDVTDIGKTFTFTASATDIDGTTNVDFHATVILAAPVLKHCPVDQWTATSFTADIQAAVPGATSYTLRYIHYEDNGTVVTGYVNDATFPYVVENLSATNYVYDVQAKRGAITSAWSNAKSIDLHNYIAPTYAIPMTGNSHGSYSQDFNGLISSGSATWYDARTIPGWYAVSNNVNSYSDMKYLANSGGSSGTGLLSLRVDNEDFSNRALGARAKVAADNIAFGVVFTNLCQYAVTNLAVSFTAMQFRAYKAATNQLEFAYSKGGTLFTPSSSGISWSPLSDMTFISPYATGDSSSEVYPPREETKVTNIPLEGEDALLPGEVIVFRWFLNSKANEPTLGIDDFTVSWECAWPRQTVIILQ